MTQTLLPPNATALERALEGSTARLGEVPVPIPEMWSPDRCPEPLLPWLAWAFDVPVWIKSWSEREKRGMIAASWEIHRRQGTLGGMERLARWAGAAITRATTPPAKKFLAKSYTREERNAFVAAFPQLRVYHFRTRARRIGAVLSKHGLWWFSNFYQHPAPPPDQGRVFPVPTDAVLRMTPRGYLWRDGEETPLVVLERTEISTTREAVTTTEVRQHGTAGFGSYVGRFLKWCVPSTASARIFTLRLTEPYQDTATAFRRREIFPGMQPVDVHPDHVAQRGTREGVFTRGFVQGCFHETTARDRLYDRLYLFDPSVVPALRHAFSFLAGVLGMPPHRAVLQVAIRGRRTIREAGRFVSGFTHASDQTPLQNVIAALRWGKRTSDKVLMDTVTRRPLVAGAAYLAGRQVAGQLVAA